MEQRNNATLAQIIKKLESSYNHQIIELTGNTATIPCFNDYLQSNCIDIKEITETKNNNSFDIGYIGFITNINDSLFNESSTRTQSKKITNIVINIRKLMDNIPDIIISAISIGTDTFVLKICGALIIAKTIIGCATVDISEKHSLVLLSLWKNKKENWINMETGYDIAEEAVNKEMNSLLSYKEYQKILDDLVKLKCIEILDDQIRIKEKIKEKYPSAI